MASIEYIDSHTAGEPTRVILSGGPDLGSGPLKDRITTFKDRFDDFRRTVILEPRGSDALVGSLLCKPHEEDCSTGVIFFNNRGYLGMCGHGAIGLAVTLAHLGKAELGKLRIDTPVGAVEIELLSSSRASIQNVPAYRYKKGATVDVPGLGTLQGDIAWGGNWFFLVNDSPLPLSADAISELTQVTRKTLVALAEQGITGSDGAEIDHVEFFGPPDNPEAHSKNFVICPGGAYDRSPCGTGTSAKLACLAADGHLEPGELWIQESIIGSRFEASYVRMDERLIVPTITGEAFVTAEGRLISSSADPFRHGITKESNA